MQNNFLVGSVQLLGSVNFWALSGALNAIEQTSNLFHESSTSYIVFQGGTDKVIDPFRPIDLGKKCISKDKTTVYFKDMWDSILF